MVKYNMLIEDLDSYWRGGAALYDYIKGTYKGFIKDYIIVENNGIGYKVFTSGSTIAKLPKVDEEVLIYLDQVVREDFIGLYGFLTREELDMFKLLLTINGVGARASLSLLSISDVNNLKYSIMTQDEKTIVRAPGIGKKIAQRIILELKDKIKPDELMGEENSEEQGIVLQGQNNLVEALAALMALGYSEREAEGALKTANREDTVENIIKGCLKHLMN